MLYEQLLSPSVLKYSPIVAPVMVKEEQGVSLRLLQGQRHVPVPSALKPVPAVC